jgi:pilus assembly protein CpaF
LADDDVWEIMINAPEAIFVKRHRGPSGYHDEVFHDDEHAVRTLTTILDDSSSAHRKLDQFAPSPTPLHSGPPSNQTA